MQSEPEQVRRELVGRYAVPYPVLCDPALAAFAAYGLGRATPGEVFAPRVFGRAALTLLQGHLVGRESGDVLQMPGVFAVRRGGIIAAAHYPAHAGDNPSDEALRAMALTAAL